MILRIIINAIAAVLCASLPARADGWYAGAHAGFGGGSAADGASFGRLDGGVHLGRWQEIAPRLKLGFEGGITFPNFLDGDDRIGGEEHLDLVATGRALLGVSLPFGVAYGSGGLAWSRAHLGDGGDGSDRFGWTFGAGLELPLARAWNARFDYELDRFDGPVAVSLHALRLGIDWRFDDSWSSGLLDRLPELAPRSDPAADPGDAPRWSIHAQATFIGQGYPAFHSPYEGEQSVSGASQLRSTASATAFLGVRVWSGGELYLNPELMQGFGLSDTHGIAAFPNGEAQRSNFPLPRFNAARLYFSQTISLGEKTEAVEDAPNQIAGERSVSRLTFTAGKFAVTDFFLVNSLSGEPRTGFLNWNIYGTGSYDWTMDLLSWTWGALAELNEEGWAVRAGYFLLPKVSNTNDFDTRIPEAGDYLVEVERRPSIFGREGKLLLFGWLARGNIGSYSEALALDPAHPDVKQTRGVDRFNGGVVVSIEQPIADSLGLFARGSWSPEPGESMGWTDCGEAFVLGGTVRGASWNRPGDTVGLAALVEGLSPVARRYFAAGGMGTIIGDGGLHYGAETVGEAYYSFALGGRASISGDYQLVANPGYNRDRGPISIFALRLHASL